MNIRSSTSSQASSVAKPGYKHTKLGWIPEDWHVKAYSDVCELIHGHQFRTEDFVDPNGEGIKVLKIGNVHDGEIRLKECDKVRFDRYNEFKRYQLLEGDILMSLTGNIGRVARMPATAEVYLQNYRVGKFIPVDIDGEYLVANLGSPRTTWDLEVLSNQAAQANFGKQDFDKIFLPIPPLPEQRRIAQVLGAWDRAIATIQQLLAAQQERKRGLMQELLTGRRRFKGLGGKWKSHRIGDLFERITRKNTVGEEHVLTISAQHGLIDQREIFNKSVAGANLAGYYLLKKGEFAYNKSSSNGYPVGAIKRLERYEQGILSVLYICFGLKPGAANSDFMAAYFDAGMLDEGIGAIAQEGARNHGLLNVSTTDFFDIDVHIPSEAEQAAIAKAMSALNKETEAIQNQLEHLTTQKRGLMQLLLTGAVRVKC